MNHTKPLHPEYSSSASIQLPVVVPPSPYRCPMPHGTVGDSAFPMSSYLSDFILLWTTLSCPQVAGDGLILPAALRSTDRVG